MSAATATNQGHKCHLSYKSVSIQKDDYMLFTRIEPRIIVFAEKNIACRLGNYAHFFSWQKLDEWIDTAS